MKKLLTIILTLSSTICLSSYADESSEYNDWYYELNINYLSGFSDLTDAYESEGYTIDFEIPIGLSFSIGKEFAHNWSWDIELGPMILIAGDTNATIIPIGAGVRYIFLDSTSLAPYVRAGIQNAFVSGDYIENGGLGYNAAVGLIFSPDKAVSWGIEAKYDNTEIEFEHGGGWYVEDIEPYGLVISAFLSF